MTRELRLSKIVDTFSFYMRITGAYLGCVAEGEGEGRGTTSPWGRG